MMARYLVGVMLQTSLRDRRPSLRKQTPRLTQEVESPKNPPAGARPQEGSRQGRRRRSRVRTGEDHAVATFSMLLKCSSRGPTEGGSGVGGLRKKKVPDES